MFNTTAADDKYATAFRVTWTGEVPASWATAEATPHQTIEIPVYTHGRLTRRSRRKATALKREKQREANRQTNVPGRLLPPHIGRRSFDRIELKRKQTLRRNGTPDAEVVALARTVVDSARSWASHVAAVERQRRRTQAA